MAAYSVLVVDDEAVVLDLVFKALSLRGYEVRAVSTPTEALELARSAPCFDLLVSDVIMPEMCGPELVRRFARICPSTAVVLMSAHITPEGLPGHAAFLSKPFQIKELYSVVEQKLRASCDDSEPPSQ